MSDTTDPNSEGNDSSPHSPKPNVPPRPEGLKLKLKPDLSFRTRPVSARSFSNPPKRITGEGKSKEFENIDVGASSLNISTSSTLTTTFGNSDHSALMNNYGFEDEAELFMYKGETLLTNNDWPRLVPDPNNPPIIKPMIGFNLEVGRQGITQQSLFFEDIQKHTHTYLQFFYGKPHIIYITLNEEESPTVVAIETPQNKEVNSVKALIKTKEKDERLLLTGSTSKDRLKSLKKLQEKLSKMKLYRVEDIELSKELKLIDEKLISNRYKFGVLYAGGSRDENEMFANHADEQGYFDDFLDWLGDKIELKGWEHFRGGLDVKGNSTGTHSVYAMFSGFEIMFHVSTLLPLDQTPGSQQLERKRHLGNDIVVIVFITGDEQFEPTTLTSHFNHVFVIVRPEVIIANVVMSYRIEIACKAGVPPSRPFLPFPPVFEKTDDMRDFLLTKLINLERVGMRGPEFEQKEQRTRKILLKNLSNTFAKKENHKLFDVSAFLLDFFGWTEKKKY